MKKLINSMLVVLLTLMTVIAMLGYKVDNTVSASTNSAAPKYEKHVAPEDTGYIFDDFNQGININIKAEK